MGGLDAGEERAAGYAADTAGHTLGARAQPSTAPMHAAVSGFIAAHAAASSTVASRTAGAGASTTSNLERCRRVGR